MLNVLTSTLVSDHALLIHNLQFSCSYAPFLLLSKFTAASLAVRLFKVKPARLVHAKCLFKNIPLLLKILNRNLVNFLNFHLVMIILVFNNVFHTETLIIINKIRHPVKTDKTFICFSIDLSIIF